MRKFLARLAVAPLAAAAVVAVAMPASAVDCYYQVDREVDLGVATVGVHVWYDFGVDDGTQGEYEVVADNVVTGDTRTGGHQTDGDPGVVETVTGVDVDDEVCGY